MIYCSLRRITSEKIIYLGELLDISDLAKLNITEHGLCSANLTFSNFIRSATFLSSCTSESWALSRAAAAIPGCYELEARRIYVFTTMSAESHQCTSSTWPATTCAAMRARRLVLFPARHCSSVHSYMPRGNCLRRKHFLTVDTTNSASSEKLHSTTSRRSCVPPNDGHSHAGCSARGHTKTQEDTDLAKYVQKGLVEDTMRLYVKKHEEDTRDTSRHAHNLQENLLMRLGECTTEKSAVPEVFALLWSDTSRRRLVATASAAATVATRSDLKWSSGISRRQSGTKLNETTENAVATKAAVYVP